jgi:transcriptional regulator with XRE-family HTH domain
MPFRNLLRQAREARGDTLTATAALLGIDKSYLSKIERQQLAAPDEVKMLAAQHFGMSVDALFFADAVESEETVPA